DNDVNTGEQADSCDEDLCPHTAFSSDEDDDPEFPISFVLEVMRKDLERLWDYFAGIMGRNKPGDIIFTSTGLNKQLSDMVSSFKAGDAGTPNRIFVDYLRELHYMRLLEKNGLVEESMDGVILKKRIDPADLVITRLPTTHYEEDDNMIKPYGLLHLVNTYYDTLYSLMIDPKLHFTFTPGEISGPLAELSVDEESRDDLLVHMSRKQQLLHVLIGVIGDMKVVSVEGLFRILNDYEEDIHGNGERTGLCVSTEYLDDLIDDLRKLRVVQGNIDRIRLTNQKWVIPGK
ncbi:MAG: hypothetical protein WCP36_11545, partial [Methanomicrobiales archaeon]